MRKASLAKEAHSPCGCHPPSKHSIRELLAKVDGLAIVPELGRAEDTGAFVRKMIVEVKSPLVIDADGLFALDHETLGLIAGHAILTPRLPRFVPYT